MRDWHQGSLEAVPVLTCEWGTCCWIRKAAELRTSEPPLSLAKWGLGKAGHLDDVPGCLALQGNSRSRADLEEALAGRIVVEMQWHGQSIQSIRQGLDRLGFESPSGYGNC